MNINDEPRSGRPSMSKTDDNIVCIEQSVLADRHVQIQTVAQEVGLPKSTVLEIVSKQLGF
jgi:hypothetical protein